MLHHGGTCRLRIHSQRQERIHARMRSATQLSSCPYTNWDQSLGNGDAHITSITNQGKASTLPLPRHIHRPTRSRRSLIENPFQATMLCQENKEKKLSQAGSFDRHLEVSLLSSSAFPYIPGKQSVPRLSLLKIPVGISASSSLPQFL